MDDNLNETAKRFSTLATRLRRLGSDVAALDSLQISPSQLALLEYVAATPRMWCPGNGRGVEPGYTDRQHQHTPAGKEWAANSEAGPE